MKAQQVRQTFLDFFQSKQHQIVPSAPMVVKGDPTLMFINSGMAPFKDIFLGNAPIKNSRVADTQKCLRVSGKHNDLEEVGVDTYHHTMFEMLGNWSFADYFKKEAITWAWELLTEVYKLDKNRLYVTVFEGNKEENVPFDDEAFTLWKGLIDENRILKGNKKDNFWEMGEAGPCGPCTEIHYDGRTDEERENINGATLVNADHPQVIEIWNVVFMEFMRKADKSLEPLPNKHVDTGMGFERLVRVLQGKQSNYDTDIFMPLITQIEKLSNLKYNTQIEVTDKTQQSINIAMRVIADHIRTISFSIADGQLPSNNGAGYVIRRILRRAIRYGYQSLHIKQPFLNQIVSTLVNQLSAQFPELAAQQSIITKVIFEEESAFYKTLELGLKRISHICEQIVKENKAKSIDGKTVFELYDTFGFPLDLTALIAKDYNLTINENEFNDHLTEQKNRSRAVSKVESDDWVFVNQDDQTKFLGYTHSSCECKIIKHKKVKTKQSTMYQLVLNQTPFYAESGGQVGDTGILQNNHDIVYITDTKKENGLIVHYCNQLPEKIEGNFTAQIDIEKRQLTENNHSATHLLHAVLRQTIGLHIEQKGSLVNSDYLRFDFSNFSKLTNEQLLNIENIINQKINQNIQVQTKEMPIDEAKATGAMSLFGEKYGSTVRVVEIDKSFSIELCGGTHVKKTQQIKYFKIKSESAVAAGIRRIEALTSDGAINYYNQHFNELNEIKAILNSNKNTVSQIKSVLDENAELKKQLQQFVKEKGQLIKQDLLKKVQNKKGINYIFQIISFNHEDEIKNILFELRSQLNTCVCVLGCINQNKPSLSIIISDDLVKTKNLNANTIIRDIAPLINGKGGGQPFYAQAGGTSLDGLQAAINKTKEFLN